MTARPAGSAGEIISWSLKGTHVAYVGVDSNFTYTLIKNLGQNPISCLAAHPHTGYM